MPSPRRDVATFAERVLGRPLWEHQIEAARSKSFITAVAAARRTGKTVLAETLATWTAFRERNVRVIVLSATQDAARRVTESIGASLALTDITRGAVIDDFATRIRLKNGSEIVSLPASQRQIRGYGAGVKLLVIDEAGFVPEELWRAAHYVALDERRNGSRILLTGTPWGGRDAFFRVAFDRGLRGDPEYASHHWTHRANPLLDHAYLERQRDRVSPPEFHAEVLGEWSDAVGALFPQALLDAAVADFEVPDLAALRPPARGALGLDYGVSFDKTAAVALFRAPVAGLNPDEEVRPRFVVMPHVWPAGAPLHECVGEVVRSPAHWSSISTETNGVGAMPSQELRRRYGDLPDRRARGTVRWNFVSTTAPLKTAMYGALLGLLERGQLVLPRHPDLLRQLAGMRFEQGSRGFASIGADDPAVHDDTADALAVSLGPHKTKRGRIITTVALYADAKRAVPDADVALDEEVVETGAGLRLYRRPVLQSIGAGGQVTLPEGARLASPPRPVDSLTHVRAAVGAALNQGGTDG